MPVQVDDRRDLVVVTVLQRSMHWVQVEWDGEREWPPKLLSLQKPGHSSRLLAPGIGALPPTSNCLSLMFPIVPPPFDISHPDLSTAQPTATTKLCWKAFAKPGTLTACFAYCQTLPTNACNKVAYSCVAACRGYGAPVPIKQPSRSECSLLLPVSLQRLRHDSGHSHCQSRYLSPSQFAISASS